MSKRPRTCCTTHADNCRFGRWHEFHGPFYIGDGIWSHDNDLKCATCGGICYGDRPAADLPAEHVWVQS